MHRRLAVSLKPTLAAAARARVRAASTSAVGGAAAGPGTGPAAGVLRAPPEIRAQLGASARRGSLLVAFVSLASVGGASFLVDGPQGADDACALAEASTASRARSEPLPPRRRRSLLGILAAALLPAWRWARIVLRFVSLVVLLSPALLAAPLLFAPGQPRHWWRLILARSLHWSGPTFQKLGQWASTRPDLFGPATRQDFEGFHSNVPTEPWHLTWTTLCGSLDPDATFSSIDREPVGAGCIAQVHRATLRSTGEAVAIKVRRAGVAWVVHRDVELLRALAWAVETLLPPLRWLSVAEAADNFAAFMSSQLDFRTEKLHLERFAERFGRSGDIAFPRPILAREELLVESFEEGVLLSNVLALPDGAVPTELRRRIAETCMGGFLQMCIVDNLTHSDMHPGNVLVRTIPPLDVTKSFKDVAFDKLVLLDAGLVTELAHRDQENLIALLEAVVSGDSRHAATLMIERSRDPASAVDPDGFVRGMAAIIDRVKLDSFRLDRVQVGAVLESVFTLARRHRVKLEPNFASLGVAVIIVEGVGRQLHPEMDLLAASLAMLGTARGAVAVTVSMMTAMVDRGRSPTEQRVVNASTGSGG